MMRVQKYMSEQGMCSRREAEELIKRGLVSINGKVVREMGIQIDPAKDKVAILPQAKVELGQKTTVVVYKPRGISSSRVADEGENIYDRLPQFKGLDIVGRLDKASEGLLMLSNDGTVARAVTGSHHGIEKEYSVKVQESTNAGRLKSLEPGIKLDGEMTLPVKTKFIDIHTFRITLREGRKHQIRRMCEHLKLTVTELKRVRIGTIALRNMKPGEFRTLTQEEVKKLKTSH